MDPVEGFAPTQEYRNIWLQYVSADSVHDPWNGKITVSTISGATKEPHIKTAKELHLQASFYSSKKRKAASPHHQV